MLLFVSLSRATVESSLWYRFRGKKKVTVSNDEWDATIWENDKWGYAVKDEKFYILIEGDTRFVFEATPAQMRSLLSRSTPFRGKINGIKVKSKNAAPKVHDKPTRSEEPKIYAVGERDGQDVDLTNEVKKAKIKGAKDLKFLSTHTMPDGSEYHYFDARSTFPDYDPKSKDTSKVEKWQDKIDEAVIKVTDGLAVGSSIMKHGAQKIPVLVVMREG